MIPTKGHTILDNLWTIGGWCPLPQCPTLFSGRIRLDELERARLQDLAESAAGDLQLRAVQALAILRPEGLRPAPRETTIACPST